VRQRADPSPLKLTETAKLALLTWRARQVPNEAKAPATVAGDGDPTTHDDAADIRPLEKNGLSWRDARSRPGGRKQAL
jgi:hypothetical protein